MGHLPVALHGEFRHKLLEASAKLLRIKIPKQAAERVVAGQAVFQHKKLAKKRLFRPGKQRHVNGALATAQHRAQSYYQKLMEIRQTSIAAARILQTLPTDEKLLQRLLIGQNTPPTKNLTRNHLT